jgi:GT2 family glycosyltransferase
MAGPPGADPAAAPAPGSSPAAPRVSIVLVNYNGGDHLEPCLSALERETSGTPIEILLVDNASSDGSAELAERLASDTAALRVLRSPVNRGYAGGVNIALEHARAEYVAVLNLDMVVTPGWLEPLLELLDRNPVAGAACPLMVLKADPGRINAAGQDVHVTGLGFNRLFARSREDAGTGPALVSGLHGGAFVIRREILDGLGGWDESGFLYHEDVQLSWLLQLLGADVYAVPASTVVHDYHLTMHPTKLYLLERNRAAMLLSNLEIRSLAALTPWLALTEAMMWGFCLLRGPRFLLAKLRSYGWVLGSGARIGERRRFVRSLRRRSDRRVLGRLRWGYPWDQFFTLGRERGLEVRTEIPADAGLH